MPRTAASRPRPRSERQMGLVVRRYGASGRGYTLDGDKLVSVSSVKKVTDKPGLRVWAAREERKLVEAAALVEIQQLRIQIEHAVRHGAKDLLAMLPSDEAWTAKLTARCGPVQAQIKALQEAAEIGHNVHDVCEWWFKKKLSDDGLLQDPGDRPKIKSEAAARSVKRFEEWVKDADVQPLASELSTCSPTHRYAGTLDELAYVAGKVAILDWKTGKGIYLEDHLQVTGYLHAYNEYGPGQIRGVPKAEIAYLIHLPKVEGDGEAEVHAIQGPELEHHFGTFKHLVPVAYRLEEWDRARGFARP